MSDVELRELAELADLDAVYRLFDSVWHPDPSNPPVTTEMLRALTKAGNYVSGAYDGDELIGACVGFFGAPSERTLHSHVAGVSDRARGRNIGYALKLHQRDWALQRGLIAIEWTFDPLIRRNAYFNLTKLGARPKEYLVDFYGQMRDEINDGDESDRLLVRWQLDAPVGGASVPEATTVLGRGDDGRPVRSDVPASGQAAVAVPIDVETLRGVDFAAAKEWRLAVREVLGGLLADGAQVTGFDRNGWYVLDLPGKGTVA
ncbi:GNAT family N-acetyltransferase [Kribbella sandramycini]|uniref:GNAT family N-acetyltransferase n=1 Tax=Kribbella sandramycini TaxID=60450 RepID=A0A7Y4L3U5_9ACTN|nr:GNAT family N-acetyltransferase [Kribbella sandramycini]MBB6570732.1 putative GNAT superfamily acetyltransferase [Kribbella sandramycini]NOL43873.1 GNAT family N-acetyltransferase [Kribbella sandramycini]